MAVCWDCEREMTKNERHFERPSTRYDETFLTVCRDCYFKWEASVEVL